MSRRLYGCVIFDDPFIHKAGWASVEGGKAFRVSGTEELPSNVVWVTNLGFELMGPSGLAKHARFRRDSYLRRDTQQILNDLGGGGLSPNKKAEVISTLFMRTVTLARALLGVREIPDTALSKGIRNAVPEFPVSYVQPEFAECVRDAITTWIRVERHGSYGDGEYMSFRLPPVLHGREILLNTREPVGAWRLLKRSELPDRDEDLAKWLMSLPGPSILRIIVKSVDQDFNHLINYGTGSLGPVATQKAWVADAELAWLEMFAKIRVTGGWICEGWRPASLVSRIGFTENKGAEISYSIGLLMENAWSGMTLLPTETRMSVDGIPTNTMAPYLRAIDRGRCLSVAARLHAMGIDVLGYGVGKVGVLMPQGTPPTEILEVAMEAGVLPPPCEISEEDDDLPMDAGPLRIAQSLAARGDVQRSLDYDEAIVGKVLSDGKNEREGRATGTE